MEFWKQTQLNTERLTVSKQETIKATTKRQGGNTILDRIWQGAAAFVILAGAYRELMRYIEAVGYMQYALAGLALGFLIYLLVAPQFRR